MGDWSEYFEDYPEENPANYVGNRFDPSAAAEQRKLDALAERVKRESRALQAKMFRMADEAKKDVQRRAQFGVEPKLPKD